MTNKKTKLMKGRIHVWRIESKTMQKYQRLKNLQTTLTYLAPLLSSLPCRRPWFRAIWECDDQLTQRPFLLHFTWNSRFVVQNVKLGKIWPRIFNGLEKTKLEPKFEVSISKNIETGQQSSYQKIWKIALWYGKKFPFAKTEKKYMNWNFFVIWTPLLGYWTKAKR